MKCSKCMEEGKKSTVTYKGSSRTLMSNSPYYNENGDYHNHDYNVITSIYSCSNNHWWEEKGYSECPSCDFGKDFHKIEFFDVPKYSFI